MGTYFPPCHRSLTQWEMYIWCQRCWYNDHSAIWVLICGCSWRSDADRVSLLGAEQNDCLGYYPKTRVHRPYPGTLCFFFSVPLNHMLHVLRVGLQRYCFFIQILTATITL